MMESQTLLLTLLSVKMLEGKAQKDLAVMCPKREVLQRQAMELRQQLRLQQKHQEPTAFLDAQIEVLSPLQAVAKSFKEQNRTLATALDTTRHTEKWAGAGPEDHPAAPG